MEVTERYDFREHIWCGAMHSDVPDVAAEGECFFCPGVKLLVRDHEGRTDHGWSFCPCCRSGVQFEPEPDDYTGTQPWCSLHYFTKSRLIQSGDPWGLNTKT